MMRCISRVFLTLVLLVFMAGISRADTVLFEYAFNLNGTIYSNTTAVPGLDASGFDTTTGLGTITLTYNPGVAGVYGILAFFDHEIDEDSNTFFNEYGSVTGPPAPGQSWEIDEPGYVFGDIWTNFTAGTLDNSLGFLGANDVSMAMGWNLILAADESATATFTIGSTVPTGFYLTQTDPDSNVNIYLSSNLAITPTGVPEPWDVALLPLGCVIALPFFRRFLRA